MGLRDFIASDGWEDRMAALTGGAGTAIVDA
jgi:hypothetical protein